jgi:hypothetical protein
VEVDLLETLLVVSFDDMENLVDASTEGYGGSIFACG